MNYRELLIGCGHKRDKRIFPPNTDNIQMFVNLTTLDALPACKPDVMYDLVRDIYESNQPFEHNTFDEIHAYEVLEHCGEQGNVHLFFFQFARFWEWLKPGGYFCATVPAHDSLWAWGDPSHTRIINAGSLIFLSRKEYDKQLGKTSMSDYRHLMGAMNFDIVRVRTVGAQFEFIMRAIKPFIAIQ